MMMRPAIERVLVNKEEVLGHEVEWYSKWGKYVGTCKDFKCCTYCSNTYTGMIDGIEKQLKSHYAALKLLGI